ncbi:DLW-39 family protein [Sanguibacter antarcticus]|uniref:Uncharacterized protein n=1 Tax=Sanguibacter antarcticus TaxID=372484 RepID=A0A2A9E8U0_9MICO|nr:DLW-39 family protein [Sanguibacter antarcticus]PFG34745.1 hypothetical protein ATL42_2666 [Sanguibacter antarcticus]
MKKLLFVIITALVGYAVWRRCTEDDIERDLWAEVTDTFE